MSEDLQLTITGDEVPHQQVVKEGKPTKRRAIPMSVIETIADVIASAEIPESDARDLAQRFAAAVAPMNSRFDIDKFMRQCGL